jgi:hypothetical protein
MTIVLVYLAVVAGEAQLSGAQYEAGGRCPLNERKRMHISCKGDVCAGWLAGRLLAWESGEWILVRVESSDSRKRQKPRLAKPT